MVDASCRIRQTRVGSRENSVRPLEGSRLKLQRATAHLHDLAREAKEYLASSPFVVEKEQESPTARIHWRLRIHRSVPRSWAAIVGDVVHNARVALDHLAWQLVDQSGGSPSRDTTFPIASSKAAFEGVLRRALAGAAPSGLRLVRRLRPYEGGNRILCQLQALDIVDKHRLLIVVGAAYARVALKLRMPVPWLPEPVVTPPIALSPADRQFPLSDGAVLFSAPAGFEATHTEVGFAFELAFGEPGDLNGAPLVPTLEGVLRHVTWIIDLAERRLSMGAAEQCT